MQDINEILAYLTDSVDGAQIALIGDFDGLLIEQYPPDGKDLSEVTVQWTKIITVIDMAAKALKGGRLQEIMITSERMMAYARVLNESLFSLIIMNSSGNFGQAKLYSKKIDKHILEIF